MVIAGFFILTLIISVVLFLNRSSLVNSLLLLLYLASLWFTGIYGLLHKGEIDSWFFRPDALGILMVLALCIISIPSLYHGCRFIATHDETPRSRGLFFAAMVLLMTACAMAYLSNHIAVTWIFVEVTTLSASVLIYHNRNIKALEGVWKYVFICAISITFIYVGILFLSLSLAQTGVVDLSFDSLRANYANMDPFWLKLAFLFIFTGFTAKLGLVPMYTAGIDAKDAAPSPAGAIFASVLMNVGFIGIYRVYALISHTPLRHWADAIVIIAALLSVLVATVYMARIKNIKRMFAYSGVEHMGLVMLGLVSGGVGVYAAILHILLHTLLKPTLFFQYGQIFRVYKRNNMDYVGNYYKYNKAGAMVVLLGFISATGMPPAGLFVSEFLIFQSLFQAHNLIILLVVLILLTMIIYGFGSNVFRLLFTPPVEINEKQIPVIKVRESLSQYLLLALTVYFAYCPPSQLVSLIQEAANLIN